MGTLSLSDYLNRDMLILLLAAAAVMLFMWNRVLKYRVDVKTRHLKSQMEQNRILYQALLEKERQKQNYFLNLSHELRTPLHVILSALQLMEDPGSFTTQKEQEMRSERITGLIKGNSYRLLRVINNLIDINKLDAGAFPLKTSTVNLGNETRKIFETVKPWFRKKAISLSYEEVGSKLTTACNLESFERVVLNLLSNALKFTPSGGDVLIMAVRNRISGDIVISVKDSGPGIPEEEHQRIFEKYLQLNGDLVRNTEGNGLGLAIVKGIMALEGGTVQVISSVSKGTEFRITYPVKEADAQEIDPGSVHRETLEYSATMEFSEVVQD